MKKLGLSLLAGGMVFTMLVGSAYAMSKFKKAFDQKYVKKSNNERFKAAFKKARCNTCHVKGKKKNVHNAYGKALAKLIEGNAKDRIKKAGEMGHKAAEEAKVLKELEVAFIKVEAMQVDPKKKDSPTFGDLIKAGKLPGAESK